MIGITRVDRIMIAMIVKMIAGTIRGMTTIMTRAVIGTIIVVVIGITIRKIDIILIRGIDSEKDLGKKLKKKLLGLRDSIDYQYSSHPKAE